MPINPRTPSYGTPRDPTDEDEDAQIEQAVVEPEQPAEPVALPPVMPRPSAPGTRAYSRPQPVAETPGPITGTTGGLVPQQAGTWDKAPVQQQRWADDPVQRRQQAVQRAEADFEARQREQNPFLFSGAVKSLAKEGGRQYIRRAMNQAEDEYGQQLATDRAGVVEQRRIEAENRKVGNEAAIQQMLATGQKYRRDEFGAIQPILDARGKPLYTPTKWEKTKHPKTGRPMLGMMDQYRQRQFKAPPLRDSPDPMDDHIYADFGEGASEPYMTKEEAAASDDLSLKTLGLSAIKKQRAAKASERMVGFRQALDSSDKDYELAQATRAANRQRAEQIALSGGNPEEAAKLEQEAMALDEQLKPQGPLALRKLTSRIDLELEQAALRHETRLIQRDEIAARVLRAGGSLESDPSYQANERALAEDEAKLGQHRRARESVDRLLRPVAPVAAAAPAPEVNKFAETGLALARGATAEGIYAAGEGGARLFSQSPIRRGIEAVEDWATEKIQGFPLTDQQKATRQKLRERAAEKTGSATVDRFARDYAQATSKLREDIRRALPVDQKFAESLQGQIAQGAGQLVGTAAAAVATGGTGIAATSLGQIYDEGYQDALQSGASPEQAHSAAMKYLPAAAVDTLADRLVIGKLLKPLAGKMTVGQFLKDVLKTGAVEGATEGAQQAYLNAVASMLEGYDPNRPLDKEVLDSIIVGSVIGGGATTVGSGARALAQRPDAAPDAPPPADETVVEPPPPAGTPGNAADVSPLDAEQAEFEKALAASDAAEAAGAAAAPVQPAPIVTEPAPLPAEPAPAVAEVPAGEPVVASEVVSPAGEVAEVAADGEVVSDPAAESAPVSPEVANTEEAPTQTPREQYDNLQQQMAALGPEKFGTPEYQALWQQSEDIKNQNQGMPPGEVSGGATEPVPAGTVDGPSTKTDERPAEYTIPAAPVESTPETRLADVKNRRAAREHPAAAPEQRPISSEQRLNDAGLNLPPISSLKAPQKLAELKAGGITTYAGKPIEDANPAQLSNALGKFRRGELTPDGERTASTQQPLSVRAEAALKKLKIDTRDKAFSGETAIAAAAWNAGLDIAIVAIKAGRTIAEAVRLAIARYKALHKGATEEELDRLKKAVEDAGSPQPPPSGNGPVNDGGNRKESKSKLGKYDYVATTNEGQRKFATEFADAHPDIDDAVKEMRGISEPAMRSAAAAELLARTMEKWESANAAEKPALMAKASTIINDVKADKTEAAQALQAQTMVNERLKPFAPLLAWMDLLRTRYQSEVADKVGEDAGERVVAGINEAGKEASQAVGEELTDESEVAAKEGRKLLKKHTVAAVDESVADRIMRMLGPLAGYRDFFTKKGVDSIAKRISDLAKSPESAGNVWTFDSIINSELGRILGEGLEKAGLKPAKGQKTPDAERIAQFLSDDALRGDKVKLIDKAVREKIAALPDAMRQQVEEAWDATVGLMADSPSSATTAKRMVQESLRAVKPAWNDVFKAGGIPALRTQVVNDIAAKVAAAQPGGEKLNLGPLRELVGKSFDEIAAVRKERYDKSVALQMARDEKRKAKKDSVMSDWLSKHASTLALLRKAAKARDLKWGDIFNGLPESQAERQQELFDRVRQEPKLANLSEAHQRKLAQNLDEAWTYLRNQIFKQEFSRLVQLPNIRPADAAKVRSVIGELLKFSNLGLLDNEAFLSAVAEKYGMEKLDGPTATKLTELAGKIQRAKSPAEKARLELEMMTEFKIAKGVGVTDYVMGTFYANLLSGITTLTGGNLGGNIAQTLFNLPTFAAANTQYARNLFRGYKHGFPEALSQAVAILSTGHGGHDPAAFAVEADKDVLELASTNRYFQELKKKNEKLAKTVKGHATAMRYVGRLLRATDALFFYPSKEAFNWVAAQKILESKYSGAELDKKVRELLEVEPAQFEAIKKQAEAEGFTEHDLSRRISTLLQEKREKALGKREQDEAIRRAQGSTLTGDMEGWAGVFAKGVEWITNKVKPGGVPIGKFVLPILRMPTNFYNETLNYTPMGLVRAARGEMVTTKEKDGKFEVRKMSDEERRQLAAKSLIGAAIVSTLLIKSMLSDDEDDENYFNITANGPDNAARRAQWRAAGNIPYSIKMGKTSISYQNTPLAMILAIAGRFSDAAKYQQGDEAEWDKALTKAVFYAPLTIFGAPVLQGLREMAEITNAERPSPERAKEFVKRIGTVTVMPRMLTQLDQMFRDDTVKDDGVPRVDSLGENVTRQPMQRFVSSETDDPVRLVLEDRNLTVPGTGDDVTLIPKSGTRKAVEMTPEQRAEYLAFAGSRIKSRLKSLLPLLKALPQEKAQDLVDKVSREEKDRAKSFIRLKALAPAK